MGQSDTQQVSIGRNAAIISIAIIFSRLTGFVRTWALAFALGNTLLSSAYQIANNLPNMLYEMVMGGILVTAFLPVYMQVKKELGQKGANAYASNILSITFLLLGIVSILATIFAAQLIFTQNFLDSSNDSATNELATFFFRFFAIQIVMYGASSVISGILNAEREYLWPAVAPIFNNLVTIVTMLIYVLVKDSHPNLALAVIGLGTSLGVLAMLLVQIPALKKKNIKIKLKINFKDPALKETLKLGLPAVLVMVASTAATSVQNAVALAAVATGPSIIYYAKLWYTLPYSFLAVPISTTLFTELSDMYSNNNKELFKSTVLKGTKDLFFTMVPFALFLIVFSVPLMTLFHVGAFDKNSVYEIAEYLCWIAPALPFYAVMMYLNKVYSAMHRMVSFSLINLFSCSLQIVLLLVLTVGVFNFEGFGMAGTAIARFVFNSFAVVALFVYIRKIMGGMQIASLCKTILFALIFGGLGALAGYGVLNLLYVIFGGLSGSLAQAFVYLLVAGIIALIVCYGLAALCKVQEADAILSVLQKIKRKLFRH